MFFKHPISIGLDISDLSLKACKLSKKRGGIYLDDFKTLKVPNNYLKNGRILEKKKTAALIAKILKHVQNNRIKNRLINTVLPETATFVKLIKIERESSNNNLAEKIKVEAARHIPYTLEDVYMDWQEIGALPNSKIQEILIGVCPKEIVQEYITVIHLAGFIPNSLEIEALPLTRSIFKIQKRTSKSLSNKNIIILDLGAARSSLILWREQKYANFDTLEFTVSLPLAGIQINQILEQKRKLNSEQAELLKIKCGLEKCQGAVKRAIQSLLKQLAQRIRHSINFHKSHLQGASINKILLCGGGANLKGLDKFLNQELKIPVEYANPLINIKNKKVMPMPNVLSFATAIGLALKDVYL